MTQPAVCVSDVCFTPSRFTGKERDSESGNDYFGARYYSSSMGRFLSPDWSAKAEPVPYAKLENPQSLNLYNYMRNNPPAGVDPDGHCCEDEPPEEEVRENENFEWDLGEARESLNRREAAELTAWIGRQLHRAIESVPVELSPIRQLLFEQLAEVGRIKNLIFGKPL
jgi:RHS repeat-associated protein